MAVIARGPTHARLVGYQPSGHPTLARRQRKIPHPVIQAKCAGGDAPELPTTRPHSCPRHKPT
eukprot:3336287-Pyramimonas_sp.AAC.1